MFRKQSIIAGLLLTTCFMLHAHDFYYYEQKTRQLLPALGINEADVTFQVTHKEASIEQRQAKPKTIFLNIEKLSQLNPDAAVFECALQANLTTLDWSKIIASPSHVHLDYSAIFSHQNLKGTELLILILIVMGIALVDSGIWWHKEMVAKKPLVLSNFDHQFKAKIIDTIYSLLLDHSTARSAFVGFEYNLKQIPTNPRANAPINTHTKQGVLFKFRQWITLHPDAWQEIKKQLKPETIALIQSIPVGN